MAIWKCLSLNIGQTYLKLHCTFSVVTHILTNTLFQHNRSFQLSGIEHVCTLTTFHKSSKIRCLVYSFMIVVIFLFFLTFTKGAHHLGKPNCWPLRSMRSCSQPAKKRLNRQRQPPPPADVKPSSSWAPTTRGLKLSFCTLTD